MKKNPKDQKTQKTIQAQPLKEIVPSSYPHIREPTPIQEPTEPHPEYTPQATPSEIFEDFFHQLLFIIRHGHGPRSSLATAKTADVTWIMYQNQQQMVSN